MPEFPELPIPRKDALADAAARAALQAGLVTNDAVNAGIADDPSATRGEIIPHDSLYGADFGIVAGNSADAVAEANASALTTALAASATQKKVLVLAGTIYIKGEVLLTGEGIRATGPATIIQKDLAENGLTINPTPLAAFDITLANLEIVGQGAANHDAAAFFGQAAEKVYLTSDLQIFNCTVRGFRIGMNIAGVAKLRTENLSIRQCRVGQELNHLQTSLQTNMRITTGDSDAGSCVFKITGGNFFANKVIGGEFGGSGFAKFLEMPSGNMHFDSINIEGISGNQTFDLTGTGCRLMLKNSRVGISYTSTQAIISCTVGTSAVPTIHVENIRGFAGTPRELEVYGATINRLPIYSGSKISVFTAATQGGTVISDRHLGGGVTRVVTGTSSLPTHPSALPGEMWMLRADNANLTDTWADNPIVFQRRSKAGDYKWSSMANDMLMRALATVNEISTGTVETPTAETDLISHDVFANALTQTGEAVELIAYGTTAANDNNKTLKFYLGTEALNFGAVAANNESWFLRVFVQRGFGGSGQQKVIGILQFETSGTIIKQNQRNPTTSAAINTKLTGTGTAVGDIVCVAARMMWHRCPSGI